MKNLYALITFVLLTAGLSAQSNLRGLFVNLDGEAAQLQYEDNDWAEGAKGYGAGVKLGYGFGMTTLYLGHGASFLAGHSETRFAENYTQRRTELGARFYFGRDPGRVVPYFEAAAQMVTSEPYSGIRTRGGGGALAPGLLVYLGEHVALDARVRVAGTYVYDVEDVGLDLSFPEENYALATAGFHLGITFYPSVRRARYRFERGGGHL